MATDLDQSVSLGHADSVGTPLSAPDQYSAMMAAAQTPVSAAPSKQTPSPATSNGTGHMSASQSASRRPPRKSTLTQQQKNQKRQRATQEQLATLELEFNKNPTPTALVRERIADEINMTERSVQIWFQNRRAKIKNLAKKSLETGEDIDSIPESMRAYLAMQAMESGKGIGGSYFGRTGLSPFGHSGMLLGDPNAKLRVVINHLTCRSLSIGEWTRVGQNAMDLVVFYSPDKGTITYYINNEQAGYKIEYPFAYVKNIYLDNNENDPNKMGGIVIELARPPHFLMDCSNGAGFSQVGDFTQDQQASHCLVHHLGGNPKVLSGQLAKLVSLDTFMNRHNPAAIAPPHPFPEPHGAPMSAPVSPTARPSSQPNFHQPPMPLFQEPWGVHQMHSGMGPPQGHKRQRSRSVPGPVDFAMFQNQPMPSFYIQPPGEMGLPHTPNIYAPVPQQPPQVNANLRIDTQAGFSLDMRQYPMSATTASPSEFPGSPGFFPPHAQEATSVPTTSYGVTPYNQGYLSPMPGADATSLPTATMSFHTPPEPSIVEQSPPMGMMGRPGSTEVYNPNDGSCAVSDDGASLNEMYSKHTLTLPMHSHSPAFVHSQQAELDMDQLVSFDPASMSPEAVHATTQ
ncbi:Homeobox domain [Geosmithia morbida]|uniref:Homeobox domain n=1 Tax=Geosmithia morbida TaxID=1094350 RepID=A0A9P4YRC9_9HYPO|nr:Homeobox domain [Geosmithia morbida]KAF4120670.1 Homeobox domain [Geosmithia morbida]